MVDRWRRLGPEALALFRIITALLLIEHATQKLLGFPAPYVFGKVTALSLPGIAGAIEAVGGALVLIGLWTRPAAFILSGEMAVAYFLIHAPRGFYPLLNGGELAIVFCFGFLYLSTAGAGAWSLDAARAAQGDAAAPVSRDVLH